MKRISKLIYISLVLLCSTAVAQAQVQPGSFGYYQDALRFSQFNQWGTARFASIGGAGSVLGGDISAATLNPAGLGLFNRSQFVITPSLGFNTFDSNFEGTNTRSERTNFALGNAGIVINFNKGDLEPGSWRGGSLAITYNRFSDFRQDIGYSAQNNGSSIIDAMLNRADRFFPEELGGIEQVGYDHYLINPVPGAEDFYVSFVEGFPLQRERIERVGQIDQVNVSFGGNFEDKIYVGAGLGFTSADYRQMRVYTESFNDGRLNQFTVDERLDISGTGVNANIGVIVRPTNAVRFGASITTPTWYSFSEESDAIYQSDYNNYDVANYLDDNGNRIIKEDTVLNLLTSETNVFFSNYNLRTPLKLNAGVAFFIGKSGFITADIERLNYSNAFVSSSDFVAENDNRTIENIYQSTTNIRLGAEYRFKAFRFRAGYASIGDATNDSFDDVDRSRDIASAGLGMNVGKYFLDLSYAQTQFTDSFKSYSFADGTGPTASIDNNINDFKITFGMNF